jgi:hypothetical protein
VEIARSTAVMIGQTAGAARPDHVAVEFGLKFSASGTVIMAGVAGEASLKVTLTYDTAGPVTGQPAAVIPDVAAADPQGGDRLSGSRMRDQ